MKIIFFANGAFSIPSLQSLIDSPFIVQAVITNTDKVGGRGNKVIQTKVSKFANKTNIDLIKIDDLNCPLFFKKIKSYNADIFVVISYRIIPEEIFTLPKFGAINIHASLLPKYKGAAPIQRSLMNGDTELGLTSFIINDRIDSGKLIRNLAINIDDRVTYGDSHDMLSKKSGDFLLQSLEDLIANRFITPRKIQESYSNKIKKHEFKISLNNNSFNVHNLFRSLTPPGPFVIFNKKKVKLFDTYYYNDNKFNLDTGNWHIVNNKLYIGCKSGNLSAKFLQFESKKRISIKDFSNINNNKEFIFQ